MENSQKIMGEIMNGMAPDFCDYVLIQNRKTAIEYIINQSQPNDVVILVGKGHETYQIMMSETIHFDDREEASNAISNSIRNVKVSPYIIPCPENNYDERTK